MKSSLWFLKIVLPVSFFVMLLSYFNILPYISGFVTPFFTLLGLPGDAALIFFTSIFTNIYTVIALMATMDFTVREGIILAVMCLISHSFIVETLVQKKTGSSPWRMMGIRLIGSVIIALILNLILPDFGTHLPSIAAVTASFSETFLQWIYQSILLSLKIIGIVVLIMVAQCILEEFGILKLLSNMLKPLMRVLGLPDSASFLWIVGNVVGLGYGSTIMLDYIKSGKTNEREIDLLNHHLAVSHSLIEDPLLFMVIGLPVLWLIIPRFLLAVVVVWLRRLEWKIGGYKTQSQLEEVNTTINSVG
ncbi:MAG: nucleoside recognition protein [Odoribacter sp.]|nr:nucleoside recognition protein [Odoribacter sp.]